MASTAFARACAIRKMHTSADFRHGTTLGPLHRYSVVLGIKSELKYNIFLQIYVRFVPDPMGSDAKNTLASKKGGKTVI